MAKHFLKRLGNWGQIGILRAQSALVGAEKTLIQACLVIRRRQSSDLLLLSIVVQEKGGGWDRGRWRAGAGGLAGLKAVAEMLHEQTKRLKHLADGWMDHERRRILSLS